MRPRLEGEVEDQVLTLVNDKYSHLSPTELIQMLISKHYHTLYPRGETVTNGKTEESKTDSTQ
ncbi:hypothetical protein NVP1161O_128 [Vibrio phage 1.161.O._10N.261.48.C5]|nr:hypothetical protein NVP1161O_128 [Vibrio phage 1.161.O._10N.261.48.C5]